MSNAHLFLAAAIFLSLSMVLAWALAVRAGNHGWVDTVWSFAVGLAGAGAALVPAGPHGTSERQWLVAGLAALWSLRLGTHILRRTLSGKDDPRYAELVRAWGGKARRRLFIFLQIQAVAGLLLVLAMLVAARNPLPFGRPGDGLGGALLALSILGAGVADRQLARFRADPANRGKVCDAGLWGLSRHPNYFFEWLGWLAYAVIAIDPGGVYPLGYAALLGPGLMYVLLVHASGIPPTEAHMLRSRGEAFRAYQRRVNAFWPGLPSSKPGRP